MYHLVYLIKCFIGVRALSGAFNPNLDDPLPGQMKKQLVLKIISGQQLPKPKDSMLGDRGEVDFFKTCKHKMMPCTQTDNCILLFLIFSLDH